MFEISKNESIPPAEVPEYIKQKIKEKHVLEEEIKKAGAILQQKNVDIKTVENYRGLEEELKKHGLSMNDTRILLSILESVKQLGYDPKKVV